MKPLRILEVGSGAHPIGKHYPNDFKKFARSLPEHVEYHGVDLIPPFVNEGQFMRWFTRTYVPIRFRSFIKCNHSPGSEIIASEAIEVRKVSKKIAEMHMENSELGFPNIFFHTKNAVTLPFGDGFFSEVHLNYVVTDPMTWNYLREMIAECLRVLEACGHILITGEHSPDSSIPGGREKTLAELKAQNVSIIHSGMEYPTEKAFGEVTILAPQILDKLRAVNEFLSRGDLEFPNTIGDAEFVIIAQKIAIQPSLEKLPDKHA